MAGADGVSAVYHYGGEGLRGPVHRALQAHESVFPAEEASADPNLRSSIYR